MKKVYHSNFTFLWPFNFFYIYIQIGPEKRINKTTVTLENRPSKEKRREQSFIKVLFYFSLFAGFCLLLGIFLFLSLYILKNNLGINIFSHSHPVKDFFTALGFCYKPSPF